MDIDAAIEEYLACKKSIWTHDSYQWHRWMLGVFQKWCVTRDLKLLPQITAVQVQAFVLADPMLASNTKHHRAQVVKGFLSWCALDQDLGVTKKMLARIEMPKVEEFEVEIYSQKDIQRLLEACERTRHPLRDRAALLLLLDTGVRIAELCYDATRPEEETGLRLEHVVFGTSEAQSYITVMGKGWKTRTLKFGHETSVALQRYIDFERPRSNQLYLFLARDEPFSVRCLQQLLERLERLTQVSHVHAHKFRHTFALHQILNGTSDIVLMKLLGHETLESTMVYIRALTHIQARQLSVSVVDALSQPAETMLEVLVRDGARYEKHWQRKRAQRMESIICAQETSTQWAVFFLVWYKRLGSTWLTAANALELLADVLPASFHATEGGITRWLVLHFGATLHKRSGICYGEEQLTLQWRKDFHQVYEWQVSPLPSLVNKR